MSRADQNKILALASEAGAPVVQIKAPKLDQAGIFRLSPAANDTPGRWSVLIAKFQPTTLNTILSLHHYEASHRKAYDAALIAHAMRDAGVPLANRRRRVSLVISLGPRQKGADKDAWWKSTLDALVRCGALRGDYDKWVELGSIDYIRAPERATRIILEDL